MGKTKIYASEQAIPAWMKVKDNIVITLFETRHKLFRYRQKPHHKDLIDFKNGVVTLYGLICQDYRRDKKLKERYPELEQLSEYFTGFNGSDKGMKWWIDRYLDVDGVIFDLNITKLTQESDDDDDFAGVDDI